MKLKPTISIADIAPDIRSRFDTSDYPKDHSSGIETGVNKKVIGMFKDEAAGKQIEEFVGLRSKLYSYKMAGVDHKKCKGVKKSVVKNAITHEDYKNCLFTRREQSRTNECDSIASSRNLSPKK